MAAKSQPGTFPSLTPFKRKNRRYENRLISICLYTVS